MSDVKQDDMIISDNIRIVRVHKYLGEMLHVVLVDVSDNLSNVFSAGFFSDYVHMFAPMDRVLIYALDGVAMARCEAVGANDITLSYHASGSPAVPPDPVFAVTPIPNTTYVSVAPVTGVNYTEHQFLKDWDGVTPPTPGDGSWTPGSISSDYNLGDYLTHTLHLFVSDGTTRTPVLPAADIDTGNGGLSISAVDNLGPVFQAGAFTVAANGDWALSPVPVDAGSGLAAAPYSISVNDQRVVSGIAATSGNIASALPVGDSLVVCEAIDKQGNPGESEEVPVTVAVAGVGTAEFGIATLTVTDADATADIPVNRVGSGAFDFKWETYEVTASGLYTPVGSGTLAFGAGDTTLNVQVTLNTAAITAEPDTKQFFVLASYDGQTATIGDQDFCEVLVQGGAAAGVKGWQSDSSSPYEIAIEAEGYNSIRSSIKTGQTGDAWATLVPTDVDRYSEGALLDLQVSNNYGTATQLDPEGPYAEYELGVSAAMVAADPDMRFSFRVAPSGPSTRYFHSTLVRPIKSISAGGSGPQTVVLWDDHGMSANNDGSPIFLEGVPGYDETTAHTVSGAATDTFTIPDTGNGAFSNSVRDNAVGMLGEAGMLNVEHTVPVSARREWMNSDEAANKIRGYIPNSDTWLLRVYPREQQFGGIDRITVEPEAVAAATLDFATEQGASTYAADHDFGYFTSNYQATGTGSPTPDENNHVGAIYPLPTATITPSAGNILPSSGQVNVSPSFNPVIRFPGLTELQVNYSRVTAPGGTRLTAPMVLTDNTVTINTPTFTSGASYTWEYEMRVRDADGAMKTFSGSHTFQVLDVTAGSTIKIIDFNQYATDNSLSIPHVCTQADIQALFGRNAISEAHANNVVLVNDPLDSGRGVVARIVHYEGQTALGNREPAPGYEMIPSGISVFVPLGAEYDEIYFAYERYIPNENVIPWSVKGPRLWGPNSGGAGEEIKFLVGGLAGNSTPPVNPFNTDPKALTDAQIASTRTDVNNTGVRRVANVEGVATPDGLDPNLTYYATPKGRWYSCEGHAKLNTIAPSDQQDGELDMWLDGVLIQSFNDIYWRTANPPGGAPVQNGFTRTDFTTWHGGNGVITASAKTQFWYYGRLIWSTQPITH